MHLCIEGGAVGQVAVGAAIEVEGGCTLIGAQQIGGVAAGGLVGIVIADDVWGYVVSSDAIDGGQLRESVAVGAKLGCKDCRRPGHGAAALGHVLDKAEERDRCGELLAAVGRVALVQNLRACSKHQG